MPIFSFGKALAVGRGVKVFLNLQTGATRGRAPTLKRVAELENTVGEQRRLLKKREQQIRHERRRFRNKRKAFKQQGVENFRLANELEAAKGPAGEDRDAAPAGAANGALPDFVILGAQKCGTTRLYNLLAQHPNFEPGAKKEAHYFDRSKNLGRGIEWYRGLFPAPGRRDGQASITGEKTPNYLFHPRVPKRMSQVLPGARLIALLRNPVDRAYSHYHHLARSGREERGFEEAVEAELAALAGGADAPADGGDRPGRSPAGLLARGIYADQLARWRRFFPEEQMLVIRGEDFFADTNKTLEEVQDFLGLPRRPIESHPRRSRTRYEPMDPATRRRLEGFFEPHNRRLYDLLGRDFGW